VADSFFNAVASSGRAVAWSGVLAFAGQIFCDFAGYSTCAIGTALAFGFQLPMNFRFPYAAAGFSDFWRRWHISLSTWLRDYLYISLGGNRRGEFRTYVNLMLTMLIGGLWHGAAWTFVIWGGLHGIYLAVERAIRERVGNRTASPPIKFVYGLITLFFVIVAWVWFRSPDIATARGVFEKMFSATGIDYLTGFGAAQKLSIVAFVLVVAVHWVMRERDLIVDTQRIPRPLLGAVLGILLALIVLSPGDNHAFIYFQF
jgi:D-alanyl-lipoteichoic acid acyltransferase DltB (MBOAT superfamily)